MKLDLSALGAGELVNDQLLRGVVNRGHRLSEVGLMLLAGTGHWRPPNSESRMIRSASEPLVACGAACDRGSARP